MLSIAYVCGASWNESHWCNEKFDKMLLQARGITDQAKRKQLYCDIQMLMAEQGSTITPAFINWIDAYATRVKNLQGHPHGFTGWMYWENVWVDDA